MTKFSTLFGRSTRLAHILTAVLAIAMLTQPTRVMADDTSDEGESKTGAYAQYADSKLTFMYGEKPTSGTVYEVDTTTTGNHSWPSSLKDVVTAVEFDSSFGNVHPKSCACWFYGFGYLLTITGLEYLNTEEVTNMAMMFDSCSKLTELDLTSFNTANVTNMPCMFEGCSSLTTLDLTSFDTSNVTHMNRMFYGCTSLTTIYASDDFDTSKVQHSQLMFQDCNKLQAHGGYDPSYLTASRANFTKQWGYFKTYYKVGDTKHEFYGIAPLSVDNLALEDGADFITHSTFTATNASYSRTMSSNWGTLCLPFAIDAASASGCTFYGLESVNDDKITLTQLTDTIDAGTPVLVYSATKKIDITASNVPVVKTPAESTQTDGWQLTGSFTETEVPDNSYVISKNKFWLVSNLKDAAATATAVKSKGLRAWLTPASGSSKVSTLDISTDEPTSIDTINALADGKAEIYDIQGHRTDKLQKGLNIVKTGNTTKKIMVK